jgi:hypothetical protein
MKTAMAPPVPAIANSFPLPQGATRPRQVQANRINRPERDTEGQWSVIVVRIIPGR